MKLNKKLKDEIWDYCRLNDITDVDKFIERMTQQGYNVEKYGNTPVDLTPEIKEIEKIVEVEVIKEVVKTVEVEVDKIIEVIKEVPVEVIKEVQVEKEIYITDDEVVNKLQLELEEVKGSLSHSISKFDEQRKDFNTIDDKNIDLNKSLTKEIKILKEKIKTISKELTEEKKIPKRVKKEIKAPESTNKKSSITWVSKDDRSDDNFYDD
jgi:hypothetical protein